MTLFKIGKTDLDNFRTDCEYSVVMMGKPIIGKESWFCTGNVMYHTERITKHGFIDEKTTYLKSRKCKYILIK